MSTALGHIDKAASHVGQIVGKAGSRFSQITKEGLSNLGSELSSIKSTLSTQIQKAMKAGKEALSIQMQEGQPSYGRAFIFTGKGAIFAGMRIENKLKQKIENLENKHIQKLALIGSRVLAGVVGRVLMACAIPLETLHQVKEMPGKIKQASILHRERIAERADSSVAMSWAKTAKLVGLAIASPLVMVGRAAAMATLSYEYFTHPMESRANSDSLYNKLIGNAVNPFFQKMTYKLTSSEQELVEKYNSRQPSIKV